MQPVSNSTITYEFTELCRVDTTHDYGMGGVTEKTEYFSDEATASMQYNLKGSNYTFGNISAVKDNRGNYYLLERIFNVRDRSEMERRKELEQKIGEQSKKLKRLRDVGFPEEEQNLKKLREELDKIKK